MRLYYGTYGHRISGKLYAYWGDDNLRTGQQVVAPVTNKYGTTYNTMFTIARGYKETNPDTQREINLLNSQGIAIKTIGGRDTLSLPGGQSFESKAAWKRDSEARYEQKHKSPEMAAAQLKQSKQEAAPTERNRLLRMKETPADTNKTKERLRAMRNKKYPGED